jgi:N-acetylglucosaminyl-diphospho-decaprenol L-rhamnosyltransferase
LPSHSLNLTKPPLSVAAIVPVFGESGGSLARTLAGLLLQTTPLDQILVVDDGSPTPASIPAELRSQVEILRLNRNCGLARARNSGADLCTAKYLLFVNCDVVLKPDWAETAVTFMEAHGAAGAVSGPIVPVIGPPLLREWRLQCIESKVHRSRLTEPQSVSWLVGHVILVRRSAFDDVNGFDPRFRLAGEDWDFSQRLLSRGHAVFHVPTLVAESFEAASVEGLARKNVRNAGWDISGRQTDLRCAAIRPVQPITATASLLRLCIGRMVRHVLKCRLRLLSVELTITFRSLVLVWHAATSRHSNYVPELQ